MDLRWLDETEMRAWVAFLDTANLLVRRVDSQLRHDGGVSQPQYELLTRLAEAPGSQLRMARLADLLVASRSGLTYQVTQLESAGLVRREPCPGDDRGVLAILTDAGRDVLHRAAPGHLRVVRDGFVDRLERDQLAVVADALTVVREHLRRTTGNPPPPESTGAEQGG